MNKDDYNLVKVNNEICLIVQDKSTEDSNSIMLFTLDAPNLKHQPKVTLDQHSVESTSQRLKPQHQTTYQDDSFWTNPVKILLTGMGMILTTIVLTVLLFPKQQLPYSQTVRQCTDEYFLFIFKTGEKCTTTTNEGYK